MSCEISVKTNVLAKILLHAAKYPHLSVSGLLFSNRTKTRELCAESEIEVVEAMPLFHGQLGLAPMLEVALTQAEIVYKAEDLIISGYYQANEHLKDNVADFVAVRITEKIAENNREACLIMLDNRKLSHNLNCSPLSVSHLNSDGKWKNKERTSLQLESGALPVASELLQRKIHRDIYDFDDHLEDVSCDWTNKHVNALVAMLRGSSVEDDSGDNSTSVSEGSSEEENST